MKAERLLRGKNLFERGNEVLARYRGQIYREVLCFSDRSRAENMLSEKWGGKGLIDQPAYKDPESGQLLFGDMYTYCVWVSIASVRSKTGRAFLNV